MKKVLIGIAVVVVLLIVAALVVPFLIPAERYKAEVVSLVKSSTGRDLRIEGPARLSVLPSLALSLKQVALANAAGGVAKDMVSLDSLDVKLKLLPLISGRVEVDSFVLVRPTIVLEVDKQGRPNWVFEKAAKPAAPAQQAPQPAEGGGVGAGSLDDVRLGDVRISDGALTYLDQRTGAKQAVEKIDMTVKLPSLDAPMSAAGNLTWNAKRIDVQLDVAKPRELMEGRSSDLALNVGSEPVKVDFKGGGSLAKLGGTVDLKVPSVRGLAAWVGSPLTMPGDGLGPLAIAGKLDVAGPKLSFTDANLSLDAIKGTGAVAVDTGGAKPAINAKLDLGELDLNPYLPPEQPAAAGTQAGGGAAPTPAPGAAKSSDWSDEPIDVSGLKAVNADLALTVAALKVRKISIGKSALKVALHDGRLVTDLTELQLYEGKGTGRLAVDGTGAVPAIDAAFKLDGIQAQPLLRDAASFERLAGTGAMDIAVNGRGKSQRQIVSALNGKGAVAFTDGAIIGINLGAMVRNVGTAFTSGGTTEKTDFSSLKGTYTITNGILKNSDLEMLAPLFRVSGAGTVDLPRKTVDYRITPKVVASAEGQGGQANLGGVMVPVIVQGPWSAISYKPDLAGLLKQKLDPNQALEALKGGAIPGLGGGTSSGTTGTTSGTTSGTTNTAPKPADALKSLFGN
jgi:AsmA protein